MRLIALGCDGGERVKQRLACLAAQRGILLLVVVWHLCVTYQSAQQKGAEKCCFLHTLLLFGHYEEIVLLAFLAKDILAIKEGIG